MYFLITYLFLKPNVVSLNYLCIADTSLNESDSTDTLWIHCSLLLVDFMCMLYMISVTYLMPFQYSTILRYLHTHPRMTHMVTRTGALQAFPRCIRIYDCDNCLLQNAWHKHAVISRLTCVCNYLDRYFPTSRVCSCNAPVWLCCIYLCHLCVGVLLDQLVYVHQSSADFRLGMHQ